MLLAAVLVTGLFVVGFAVVGPTLIGGTSRPAEAAPPVPGPLGDSGMDLQHPVQLAGGAAPSLAQGSPDATPAASAVPADISGGVAGADTNGIARFAATSVEPEQLKGYSWPLKGARIMTWFRDTPDGFIVMRGKRVHDGLDIATFCGQHVVAAHSGTVLYAGREFGPYIGFDGSLDEFYAQLRAAHDMLSLPRVVVIDDGNGYRSAYVHLGSQSVVAGDVVKAGDVIGKEGATGHASGCHLHYSLIRMDGPLVPVAPELVKKYHYPAFVRERIDPLRVLSFKAPGAARRVPGIDPPAVPYRYEDSTDQPLPTGDPDHPQPGVEAPV